MEDCKMDSLKNFIDQNRAEFETENLLNGHKERYFKKLQENSAENRKIIIMPYWMKLAVASVILIILVIPVFVNNRLSQMESGEYYIEILSERSLEIEQMASSLSPDEKLTVESTIRQLNEESISLATQIPESLSKKEKRSIIKGYYTEKIEGADRLKKYVESIVEK